jgi:hypothetical protein
MRAESRDSFRATVLRWNTPLVTARCSSGCAARNASCACALSPPEIACSTFPQEGAHPRAAGAVADGALLGLADALAGGCRVRHGGAS